MDVTLVEHSEDEIHNDHRGGDEVWLRSKRRLKRLCGSLECRIQRGWQANCRLCCSDRIQGGPERRPRSEVERDRDRRELALMTDREIIGLCAVKPHEGAERHHLTGGRRPDVDLLQRL